MKDKKLQICDIIYIIIYIMSELYFVITMTLSHNFDF